MTTTPSRPDFREQQADDAPKWWREFSDLERSVVLITMVVIIIAGALYGLGASFTLISDFAPNVMTEILFFAFTIVVIDRLNRERSKNERKEELILQMGSSDNGFATEAVRLIHYYGWSRDGALCGARLAGANLAKVNLGVTNLQEAVFWDANLEGASFSHANLQLASFMNADLSGADLRDANLRGTDLRNTKLERADLSSAKLEKSNMREAKLQDARLWGTQLEDADLWRARLDGADLRTADLRGATLNSADLYTAKLSKANLEEADFSGANLQGAVLANTNLTQAFLREAEVDKYTNFEGATLPDGTKWSPDVDMKKFTDPDHPEFWQPDWVKE